ncbi:MAG: Trk system potassium transporter TrkA [Firmicutes bacterium]|nr:Trk system potassium transporter TrkA [Bacillota bacterium]
MKAVIIGCGDVGLSVADMLIRENHNVTLIDRSEDMISSLSDDLDAMVITGNGNAVSTLREADVEHADTVIAVTDSDEVNLLCCMIAKKISSCSTIARVRDPVYIGELDFIKDRLGIDLIINPEFAAAREISRLLLFPAADSIVTFARNRILLTNGHLREDNGLNGTTLAGSGQKIGDNVLVAAVERQEEIFIPDGSFRFQSGDRIFVLASPKQTKSFYKRLGFPSNRVKNVLIAGGGAIAYYLADLLCDMNIRVHIIEKDPERAKLLSDKLPRTVIIQGDATDRDTLISHGLLQADAFVTLMGADEENVMISLFAKTKTNSRLVMKVDRPAFRDIIDQLKLESVVYPDQMTSDFIIQYLRSMQNTTGNNVETLYHMFDGRAEALEFLVRTPSPVTGIRLRDLKLKKDTLIGCINRHGRVIVPKGNDMIQIGDTVVIVTAQKGLHDLTDILK